MEKLMQNLKQRFTMMDPTPDRFIMGENGINYYIPETPEECAARKAQTKKILTNAGNAVVIGAMIAALTALVIGAAIAFAISFLLDVGKR